MTAAQVGAARAYYNEFDPGAAAWLRELIAQGHIAPGDVDTRSIADVQPDDLKGYTQAHFFAGIGGWSLALRLGGWPDDRPVWTGSCPCQPFSAAGKRRGTDDERHLWPEMRRLIAKRRPPVVFGEQVASKDGRAWLAAVRADLETLGHAVGAADLCSAGVGSPNIRQRLWWVADADQQQRHRIGHTGTGWRAEPPERGGPVLLGDANLARLEGRWLDDGQRAGERSTRAAGLVGDRVGLADRAGRDAGQSAAASARYGRAAGPAGGVGDGGLAHADRGERYGVATGQGCERDGQAPGRQQSDREPERRGGSFWSALDWLPCRDGKARPVEPGTFPLAHGVPGRVGLLRGYGNAINPWVAAEFIGAFLDVEAGVRATP